MIQIEIIVYLFMYLVKLPVYFSYPKIYYRKKHFIQRLI